MKLSTVKSGANRSAKRTNAAVGQSSKGSLREAKTTSANTLPGPVPKAFLDKLGEMHTAERELTLALPLVVASAESKDLKALLNLHLKETRGHVRTLEQAATSLGVELPLKRCKQMTQHIKDAVKVIGKRLFSGQQDQELIAIGRKIEQFEIEAYRALAQEAEQREFTHEHALLRSILSQEELANELLGELQAGRGPLDRLVEKASLKRAGARARS
jgi:ferritin-like metal-binding protein YciE